MHKNMIDLINRLVLWNSWKNPRDAQYIDYFILEDGSISVKISSRETNIDKNRDSNFVELIIKESDRGFLSIYESFKGKDDERDLEIVDDDFSVFHAMQVILEYKLGLEEEN